MFRKRTFQRRKAFLLDSNQTLRKKPKRLRNRGLDFLAKVLFLHQILKLFRASFLFSAALFCMAGFVLFSIFSPYFNLKKISIVRDNPNIDIEKIETTLQEFYGKNLLFLQHKEIEKQLLNTFLEFRKIDISENWPSEMKIKITISPPIFTLFNTETANFSVISEDGIILSEQPQDELVVLKIQDYKKTLSPGEKFTDKETLEKIKQAKLLLEYQVKYPTNELLFFPIARELHLVSEKNTEIWIDLQLDIEPQIRKLELSANEIGLFSKNLEHIDLRIPKQIFWK